MSYELTFLLHTRDFVTVVKQHQIILIRTNLVILPDAKINIVLYNGSQL